MYFDNKKFNNIIIIMVLISIILIFSSFAIGYYEIKPIDVINTILYADKSSNEYNIIFNIRFPRILGAFLIGGALSMSGSAYQGMFKNPLVSPDILGVSAGAGMGASIAITLNLPYYIIQFMAFLFGMLAVFICYISTKKSQINETIALILSGLMIETIANAFTTFLKYIADTDNTLPEITFWLMGSLAKIDKRGIIFSLFPMIVGFIILFVIKYRINILTLSDEESKSIGINPIRTRIIAILGATLLSASSVCLGGLIGFVGLIIPHISRWLVGAQYEKQIPISFLIGGCFLLFIDNIARSAFIMEIPIGILTAFIGAPFFLYLVINMKK